jgi:2,3-bisphosphoglycerate-dependent phosphoglycerate mutase
MSASMIAPLALRPLFFVRHGATMPNLRELRCGGDLDIPMTDDGRAQVVRAADLMRESAWPIDRIVASDLQRTRESARIIAAALGGLPITIEPGWRERALGRWNLRPIAETDEALRAGQTPPGGESSEAFRRRIVLALERLLAHGHARWPLVVGSKGVARILRELLGAQRAEPVRNGDVLCFDLARLQAAVHQSAQETQRRRVAEVAPLFFSAGVAG